MRFILAFLLILFFSIDNIYSQIEYEFKDETRQDFLTAYKRYHKEDFNQGQHILIRDTSRTFFKYQVVQLDTHRVNVYEFNNETELVNHVSYHCQTKTDSVSYIVVLGDDGELIELDSIINKTCIKNGKYFSLQEEGSYSFGKKKGEWTTYENNIKQYSFFYNKDTVTVDTLNYVLLSIDRINNILKSYSWSLDNKNKEDEFNFYGKKIDNDSIINRFIIKSTNKIINKGSHPFKVKEFQNNKYLLIDDKMFKIIDLHPKNYFFELTLVEMHISLYK